MKELKPWAGHTPIDRGSVWYLAPLACCALGGFVLAVGVLVAMGMLLS